VVQIRNPAPPELILPIAVASAACGESRWRPQPVASVHMVTSANNRLGARYAMSELEDCSMDCRLFHIDMVMDMEIHGHGLHVQPMGDGHMDMYMFHVHVAERS